MNLTYNYLIKAKRGYFICQQFIMPSIKFTNNMYLNFSLHHSLPIKFENPSAKYFAKVTPEIVKRCSFLTENCWIFRICIVLSLTSSLCLLPHVISAASFYTGVVIDTFESILLLSLHLFLSLSLVGSREQLFLNPSSVAILVSLCNDEFELFLWIISGNNSKEEQNVFSLQITAP